MIAILHSIGRAILALLLTYGVFALFIVEMTYDRRRGAFIVSCLVALATFLLTL